MRIGLAQINAIIGDLEGNTAKIIQLIEQGLQQQLDLLVFPELAITGYSPQDLWWEPGFIEGNLKALKQIAQAVTGNLVVIIGYGQPEGEDLFNAAAIIQDRQVKASRYKTLLPNYDVFDERRYFTPAPTIDPVTMAIGGTNICLGVEICEDLWDKHYDLKVSDALVQKGAELLVNISASPFEYDKRERRLQLAREKAQTFNCPFVLVNLVGGGDEMVFDGNSFVLDSKGEIIGWGGEFQEGLTVCELDWASRLGLPLKLPVIPRAQSIFEALKVGVRDYFYKTGARQAVIGLSGGIDSALVSCVAVEALGRENVLGVLLPSRFTSQASIEDAQQLANNLGIQTKTIPIEPLFQTYLASLQKELAGRPADITEENIQARIRGNILMALANRYHYYLLSTGNKTELSLGYCTLYGDMCGALAVIADLSKMVVYEVARWYNQWRGAEVIPERIFTKIPTAELRPEQVDPFDYPVVSPLVDLIIVEHKSRQELIALGYAPELVDDLLNKIRLAEYKRHQSPPAIKVTSRTFGLGRRMPIINYYTQKETK